MKKFLWILTKTGGGYPENKTHTELVQKCIWLIKNCPFVSVTVSQYYINIKTNSTDIELWNENKFYSWLCSGKVNGRKFKDSRPSWSSMYDFKECLRKNGHDIFLPKKELPPIIDITDVKC